MRNTFVLLLGLLLLFATGCEASKSEGSSMIDNDVEFGELDYEKIINGNNDLGFKVLRTIEPDEQQNAFISPVSLYMALSMVYNGADQKTKAEMEDVLQMKDLERSAFNKANISLLASLYKDTELVELQIGNSLWLHENYQFQEEFADDATSYFNGEIEKVAMSNSDTPQQINNWVSEATNGKITDIIEGPLDESILAYLINAVYFNGDWQYEFDKQATKQAPFYVSDGMEIDAKLMQLETELPYFETEDFQAIKLPYGEGEMSMNVFLPKEHVGLEAFVDQLSHDHWQHWNEEFYEKKGTVLLPKFQLEYETELTQTLSELGMKDAFDGERADFSKLIKENDQLFISDIKQKTFIDVNEAGTEAAGATSVEMKLTSAPADGPFYMEVNRPFFLTINDEETGAILFMGTISHPET